MRREITALIVIGLGVGVLAVSGGAGRSEATPYSPVLVELFTSEGCSSCPPADALLEKLDASNDPLNPQIIVLSEHVDYWNSAQWKDPFSSAAFSERQNSYGERFRLGSVYTPEMVVNGSAEVVGNDEKAVRAKIALAATAGGAIPVSLFDVSPGIVRVEIDKVAAGKIRGSADVMVAVASNEASTQVLGGENGGRKLHHVAVVRTMKTVGEIREGQFFSKEIEVGKDWRELRVVAWVQERGQGRVLGVGSRIRATK
jgi:hypothetical protein